MNGSDDERYKGTAVLDHQTKFSVPVNNWEIPLPHPLVRGSGHIRDSASFARILLRSARSGQTHIPKGSSTTTSTAYGQLVKRAKRLVQTGQTVQTSI